MVPVFVNFGESSMVTNYHPISFSSVISEIFEKLFNTRLVNDFDKCGFSLISSMVSSLFSQLQIFCQLDLIELLGLLIGLVLLEMQHLIYPWLSTGFGMQVFFIHLFFEADGIAWF